MLPDRAETVTRTAPRSILLVEDEPDARTILSRRLQAFGWNCLAHASVEGALSDPDLRYVDAVVADVVLGEARRRRPRGVLPPRLPELAARSPGSEAPCFDESRTGCCSPSAPCSHGRASSPGCSSPSGCAASTSPSPACSRTAPSSIRWRSWTVFSAASRRE